MLESLGLHVATQAGASEVDFAGSEDFGAARRGSNSRSRGFE
jgi:hypothetical protein